jgi:hypothetical protein
MAQDEEGRRTLRHPPIHIAFSRSGEHAGRRLGTGALSSWPRSPLSAAPWSAASPWAAPARAPPRRSCTPRPGSSAETREAVKAHRLIEPYAALKFAAEKRKGEALSAKLCHIGDEFIYEITLLHRDGRLVHVAIEAATGKLIPRAPREPHAPSIKN